MTEKCDLTGDEIETLLDEAENAFPESDFVASVRSFYEERDFITERQEEALRNIAERNGDA